MTLSILDRPRRLEFRVDNERKPAERFKRFLPGYLERPLRMQDFLR